MNFDLGFLNQALNALPYPISTSQLIQFARERGVNDQIMGMLEKLPDKTFNSAQEIQEMVGGMGGLGGALGGLFK